MAEYYYNQSYREPRKKRSLVMRILDVALMLCSVVAFALTIILIFTPSVSPSRGWIFPIVSLFTPAIYLSSALLALYWVIRWRWRNALLLIVPVAIATPRMALYTQIETAKHYEHKPTRAEFKLVTFNTKNFTNLEGQLSVDEAVQYIEEQNPNIIVFQEYDRKRFKGAAESSEPKYNIESCDGQSVWSRFKIVDKSGQLIEKDSLEKSGSAFWVDLLVGRDTLRLFNLHLHSTSITSIDNDYISSMEFLGDSLREDKFTDMLSRFKETSVWRAKQAGSIAQQVAQSPYKVIVCGDFNDTPNSYAYHKISKGLDDTFREQGSGYSYTYNGFMNLLRIDYVLVAPQIDVISYDVDYDYPYSDHFPVVTTLKIK